jgi:hypothetical protein
MNSTGTPEKTNAPDSEIEWYDFGGGNMIAPTTYISLDGKTENILPGTGEGPNMAALCCVRNGLFYFKIFEGDFTVETLTSMFKDYAPSFKAEVEAKTQETQQ